MGKGWVSSLILIGLSLAMLVAGQGGELSIKWLVIIFTGLVWLLVFALRGTLGYRKYALQPDNTAFD